MELVAFVGEDKENWGQVTALLNRMEYAKAILIQNKSAESFPANDKAKIIKVDTSQSIAQLTDELREKLKKEISKEFEVALSLASGNGKEHMAFISALLGVPLGIKLVAFTKNGIEFLD